MVTATIALITLTTTGKTELVLTGLDPIDLINGVQIRGFDHYKYDYLRYRYLFSTKEHYNLFAQNPEKYAVQDGGACGKMGPLTGKGSPDRFAVINKKIYLFASDGCRTGFVNNPDPYFAQVPAPPRVSTENRRRAQALFTTVRKAHGLNQNQTMPSVQWTVETPYKSNGEDLIWYARETYVNEDTLASWWGDIKNPGFFLIKGQQNLEGKYNDAFAIAPSEQRELRASFLRHPSGVLGGAASNVVALSEDGLGFVTSSHGITSTILLDPQTNRIATIKFTDHYSGPVASVERRFSDYIAVNDIWLPKSTETKVNNGNWSPKTTAAKIEVGIKPPELFTKAFK